MRTDLRAKIEQARQRLQLAEQDFASRPFTTNWPELEKRIYYAFCQLNHPTARPLWLWERFQLGFVFEDKLLTHLISRR